MKKLDTKPNFPKIEKEILKFWQDNKIFNKLREKNKKGKIWSFLDGPITANNPMGVHHAWGRTYKDMFQRYKAMKGFRQRYQNGFDCQGLWVEVEVEKELGFNNKKDIEKYGIEKFVNKCKERALKYAKIQTIQSIRLGQWMDWENSYYTFSDENNYAIWHFLKKCHQNGYLYKGRDSVPWCPRCGAAISQHEILSEEYQEIEHKAVYFKLPIKDKFQGTSFLVWTTTPWTIPANVALAVHPDYQYGLYNNGEEKLIVLKKRASKILDLKYKLERKLTGKELSGLKYIGPFDILPRISKASKVNLKTFHSVVLAKDLVTEDEGTGIVHIAPGAGAEDFKLGKSENLAIIDVIDDAAFYLDEMGEFSGQNAKDKPELILDYLKTYQGGNFFYRLEDYTHRYPTCWRCKTELVWRVVDEWYIAMDPLRSKMIEIAKKIEWLPAFGLNQELDWLKNMGDWLISKKRYWGLALPIWECSSCKNFEVIGSKMELVERAVEGWDEFMGNSPHRPWIDKVKIKCEFCGKIISRIKDVGNPWLDAGIVPFSTMKYFEEKNYWKDWFPAEFICESFPGQFRNWFYSLIAMSTVLEGTNPYITVLGHATVKDEKGEEMHKSKGNAIWFDEAVDQVGADPLRLFYISANPFSNLLFGYNNIGKVVREFMLLFWNIYSFYLIYLPGKLVKNKNNSMHLLDQWIEARMNQFIEKLENSLDKYDPYQAMQETKKFLLELSTWYLRLSRKRKDPEFWQTFDYILKIFLQICAPIMPYMTEFLWQKIRNDNDPESIHLVDWPKSTGYDAKILNRMEMLKTSAELGHSIRSENKIKLRQPLGNLYALWNNKPIPREYQKILLNELNVKKFTSKTKGPKKELKNIAVILDIKITNVLREEGLVRDIVRYIQELRKKAGLVPRDKIQVNIICQKTIEKILEKNKNLIIDSTGTMQIRFSGSNLSWTKKYLQDGNTVTISIAKEDTN